MEQIHQQNFALASEMSNTKQTQVTYQGADAAMKQRAMLRARAQRAEFNKNIGASAGEMIECESADDIKCPEGEDWLRVTIMQIFATLIQSG
jgi:hypothetical protein